MKITTKTICRIALMSAMLVALKEVLSWLPNGEVVTSIMTVGTIVFGPEMLLTAIVFTFLEVFIYGFSLWVVMYLIVWPLWVLLVLLLRKFVKNKVVWCLLESLFGLSFGTICSIPYWFIGGPSLAIPWIISGLSFDFMHCAWNLVFGFLTYDTFMNIFRGAERFTDEGYGGR